MWLLHGNVLLHIIHLVLFTLPGTNARFFPGRWKGIPFVPTNPPPTIRVYQNDPDFPAPEATGKRLQQAWLDMWHIAAVACVTLYEEEDVYQRYFGPGDSAMVRQIFCNVAAIEDPTSCDISTMGSISNFHMQDLTIIVGLALPDEIPQSEQPDLNNPDLHLFCTTFQDRGPKGNKAYTQVYKRAFDYPSLNDIFNKRTCAGLGRQDSGLMTSLGAHLLNEMIHWRLLVRAHNNEEQFDEVIPHTVLVLDPNNGGELEEEDRDYIDDYDRDHYEDADIDPSTGYGPTNAHELVINGDDACFRNADNYRWYAVSKYWSWKCTQGTHGQRVVFGQQDNNDLGDAILPRGCDAQIPCPGS